jgi:hypothetical protein
MAASLMVEVDLERSRLALFLEDLRFLELGGSGAKVPLPRVASEDAPAGGTASPGMVEVLP